MTLTATLRRFVNLTDSRCALVISENRKITYSIPSKTFGFRIQSGAPVDGNSFAVDFFNFGYLDEQMKSVRANAWIRDSNLERRVWIKEQSIAQRRYKSVLTLLWVE